MASIPATDIAPGKKIAGIGVVFLSPEGQIIPFLFALESPYTNSESKYEALISGFMLAKGSNIRYFKIYGNFQLAVRQIQGLYEVKKEELKTCLLAVFEMPRTFHKHTIDHVPRSKNSVIDVLARLATSLVLPKEDEMVVRMVYMYLILKRISRIKKVDALEELSSSPNDEQESD